MSFESLVRIDIRRAVADFLSENGITLNDLFEAMDEGQQSLGESLRARVYAEEAEIEKIERSLTAAQMNYLMFVVQTFYLVNVTGIYKGLLLVPPRDEIVLGNRATMKGLRLLAGSLGLPEIG